jgi:hypothetical protein
MPPVSTGVRRGSRTSLRWHPRRGSGTPRGDPTLRIRPSHRAQATAHDCTPRLSPPQHDRHLRHIPCPGAPPSTLQPYSPFPKSTRLALKCEHGRARPARIPDARPVGRLFRLPVTTGDMTGPESYAISPSARRPARRSTAEYDVSYDSPPATHPRSICAVERCARAPEGGSAKRQGDTSHLLEFTRECGGAAPLKSRVGLPMREMITLTGRCPSCGERRHAGRTSFRCPRSPGVPRRSCLQSHSVSFRWRRVRPRRADHPLARMWLHPPSRHRW